MLTDKQVCCFCVVSPISFCTRCMFTRCCKGNLNGRKSKKNSIVKEVDIILTNQSLNFVILINKQATISLQNTL